MGLKGTQENPTTVIFAAYQVFPSFQPCLDISRSDFFSLKIANSGLWKVLNEFSFSSSFRLSKLQFPNELTLLI